MTITDTEHKSEQQRVEHVAERIAAKIGELEQSVGQLRSHVVESRKNFWDDITVNIDNHEDIQEMSDSIRQQAMVVAELERHHKHSRESLVKLIRLRESPYFGRIDFTENGYPETERIYIGIASFMDEQTEQFYVYDWRAPISSLFYDYAPGPAQYATPSGNIAGKVEVKRQYVCQDGKLLFVFDTGVTIGDEMLQQVLGKNADTHMHSIVATIQREQNEIIRSTGQTVFVQGAAGSGKTSVALQRIAYLLYKYRDTISADNMVLFSPNPIFNMYVSNVLPELGEANIQQTTFQEYIVRRLGGTIRLEDAYEQLEYALERHEDPDYSTRMDGIRFKASAEFYKRVVSFAASLELTGIRFRNIEFRGRVLIAEERMVQWFYAPERTEKLRNRIGLLKEWLLAELKELEKRERQRKWVADEIELLDKDDYHHVYEILHKKKRMRGDTFDDADMEKSMLSRYVVNEAFRPLVEIIRQLEFIDPLELYRQLFTVGGHTDGMSLPDEQWQAICGLTTSWLDRGELAYEDSAPLLLLKELLEGFQTVTSVKYVIIDEGQDYSNFQFLFLRKLFPYARFTVLGDRSQSIMAFAAQSDNEAWMSRGGMDDAAETFRLTRSYRSTKQIVEFTRELLADGTMIDPFNRPGELPSIAAAANSAELQTLICRDVEKLKEMHYHSIAILCKTSRESEEAYAALKDRIGLTLITKQSRTLTEGTLVMPAYLAKGVEFDAVLIYNASEERYSREEERLLFYTACTRAMHRLNIYYKEKLTPFVAKLAPSLYHKV